MTDKQAALDAALAQIDAHFGKGPDTPERRRARAKHDMERLVPALEGARAAADAEKAAKESGEDDCPDIALDPFSAYAAAWFLRREADTDATLAKEHAYEALEEAADHIATGEVFGSAEELLADLVAEIHYAAYVIEHGEDPPGPVPPAPYAADDPRKHDNLPF